MPKSEEKDAALNEHLADAVDLIIAGKIPAMDERISSLEEIIIILNNNRGQEPDPALASRIRQKIRAEFLRAGLRQKNKESRWLSTKGQQRNFFLGFAVIALGILVVGFFLSPGFDNALPGAALSTDLKIPIIVILLVMVLLALVYMIKRRKK